MSYRECYSVREFRKRCFRKFGGSLSVFKPLEVKNKTTGQLSLIVGFEQNYAVVFSDGEAHTLEWLFDKYVFMDGTPCGIWVG